MRKLVLETTAPFQGLPELVADKEGLFEKEGVKVEWVDRDAVIESAVGSLDVDTHKGASPFASHGKLLEEGKADMYNACEWGNYCRADASSVGSRQADRSPRHHYLRCHRRAPRFSFVYTAQQLANRTVGVPFFAGTHYLALHLLGGFLPREEIKLASAPTGGARRLKALMNGEVEATTLTEPYVTVAEKMGCRVVCSAFYHGTEVASDKVDSETYAAFNRAVREAVRRINANKEAYLHYFIDYYKAKDPQVAALKVSDLRASRSSSSPIPRRSRR